MMAGAYSFYLGRLYLYSFMLLILKSNVSRNWETQISSVHLHIGIANHKTLSSSTSTEVSHSSNIPEDKIQKLFKLSGENVSFGRHYKMQFITEVKQHLIW